MRIITPYGSALTPDGGGQPLVALNEFVLDQDIAADLAVGPVTLLAGLPSGMYLITAAIYTQLGTGATGTLTLNINYTIAATGPATSALTILTSLENVDSMSTAFPLSNTSSVTYDYAVTGFTVGTCPTRIRLSVIKLA